MQWPVSNRTKRRRATRPGRGEGALGSCDPLQLGPDAHHHRGHPCTERSDQRTLKKCRRELSRRVHSRLLPLVAGPHPCSPWPVHMGAVSIAPPTPFSYDQFACVGGFWLLQHCNAATPEPRVPADLMICKGRVDPCAAQSRCGTNRSLSHHRQSVVRLQRGSENKTSPPGCRSLTDPSSSVDLEHVTRIQSK